MTYQTISEEVENYYILNNNNIMWSLLDTRRLPLAQMETNYIA